MNIKEILKDHGYEIVKQVDMKYFRLKFTGERLERMLNNKELYDYDLRGEFNVEITEMGFNDYGGLYIVLTCIDNEHFEIGDTFDVIEYQPEEEGINQIITKEQALGYMIKTCRLFKMPEKEIRDLVTETKKSIEIWTKQAAEEAYIKFFE